MKWITNGAGSGDYYVIDTATGRKCTFTAVLEPMQDKRALKAVEAFCGELEPSEEKAELQAFIADINR